MWVGVRGGGVHPHRRFPKKTDLIRKGRPLTSTGAHFLALLTPQYHQLFCDNLRNDSQIKVLELTQKRDERAKREVEERAAEKRKNKRQW